MSKFQLILTGIFAAFIVLGIMFFAFSRGNKVPVANLTLWGTYSSEAFTRAFNDSTLAKNEVFTIRYVEKNPATFDQEFIEALASGTAPDLVLLPHDMLLKHEARMFEIPYGTYSERAFKDTFVEEGELFLRENGIVAFPLAVDPLVMYWNRSTFTNASIAQPPAFWDEFYTLAQRLTQKDGAFNLVRSTVALGEYSNVQNAKEILSALFLQAGTPIIEGSGSRRQSALSNSYGLPVSPAVASLTFFTEFSNPAKPFYSWNRSLPNSQNMFTAGDLAVYFGFASELQSIRLKNPNLNFDVSSFPQSRTASRKTTYGKMASLAIVRATRNVSASYVALGGITARENAAIFANALRIAPTRRDLLASAPSDAYGQILRDGALWSKAWSDPDTVATDRMFRDLIETITSGRSRLDAALRQAHLSLQDLLGR